MEMMDSHPKGPFESLPDAVPDPSDKQDHWLYPLIRADALALTSVAIAVTAILGLPVLRDMLSVFIYNPQAIETGWQYGPTLVAAGVVVLVGLFSLRQAAAQRSQAWVKALAGASTLVGVLIAIGVGIVWIYSPDIAEIFGDTF